MIPLIRNEVVKANGWTSDEEFMELYAVASSLTGPIAINLAGHFGRRVAGVPGALAGLLGLTSPSGPADPQRGRLAPWLAQPGRLFGRVRLRQRAAGAHSDQAGDVRGP